jgi:hypothetical protein
MCRQDKMELVQDTAIYYQSIHVRVKACPLVFFKLCYQLHNTLHYKTYQLLNTQRKKECLSQHRMCVQNVYKPQGH